MKSILFTVLFCLFLLTYSFADFDDFDLISTWMPPVPDGPANGSSIGRSMSFVGDVNGDGFDDLAITSEIACDTATAEITGKVYIYLGRIGPLSMPDVPDIILKGEEHDGWFGYDVSGGDFNADGYDDIAILAYKEGKAYVYSGAVDLQSVSVQLAI